MPAIHFNCASVGSLCPFNKKNPVNRVPAISCLMEATSSAGTFCTAILLAIQLVPHTVLVMPSAIYAFCLLVNAQNN